jgi:hypothetical protein
MSTREGSHTEQPTRTEVEVKKISVNATYHIILKADSSKKKKAAAKTTSKTKNKEMSFTFVATAPNYLSFLSSMLSKHGYEKYTPVTNSRRFSVRVLVPPAKA